MNTFTVNYRRNAGREFRGQLFDRGFFLSDLPRLILVCRLFGHRPVVDGTEPLSDRPGTDRGHRWVCCDRCGVRSDPQGTLDPVFYAIGDRYTGPWTRTRPSPSKDIAHTRDGLPGPIEAQPRGKVGSQLVLGGCWWEFGWEVKVGNCGSEHTLAASAHLGWFAAAYVHTERYGTWLQRRLNPVGNQSRLIGMSLRGGELVWRLWSPRDGIGRHDGERWWQHGTINLRWLDKLLGPRCYAYTDAATATRRVQLPDGDYLVRLTLQRRTFGRRRGRKKTGWTVDWAALGRGLPTRGPERGRIFGATVDVPDSAVQAGTWPAEAVAAIAAFITRERTWQGWEPLGRVPVTVPA